MDREKTMTKRTLLAIFAIAAAYSLTASNAIAAAPKQEITNLKRVPQQTLLNQTVKRNPADRRSSGSQNVIEWLDPTLKFGQ
jgi:hypothetical protein